MCVTINMSHSSLKRSEENVVTPDHGTERVCMEEASAVEVRKNRLRACSYMHHDHCIMSLCVLRCLLNALKKMLSLPIMMELAALKKPAQ